MKDKPLGFQIWILITCFVSIISILIAAVVFFTIDNYFNNETFKTLELKNSELLQKISNDKEFEKDLCRSMPILINEGQTITSFIVSYDSLKGSPNSKELNYIIENALKQTEESKSYFNILGDKKFFYTITKFKNNDSGKYLVSYICDTTQKKFAMNLLIKLLKIITIVATINIVLAKITANRITAPLRYLEKQVRKIANKEWTSSIDLNRKDEIGRLAVSINSMQQSLRAQDMEEQAFLQTVSHDLKTPIMVIRSYSQAIKDGFYLNNSLEETADIIEKEAFKLEKKVKNLLYLNSLDYLRKKSMQFTSINLKDTIKDITNRLSFHQKNISFNLNVKKDSYITGNRDELTVALENILENYLRYAESKIDIYSKEEIICDYTGEHKIIEIIFENDGPQIDQNIIDNLFLRFHKGKNGNFGLGLSITQKIIEYHNGTISINNIPSGVSCTITFKEDNL